MLSSEVPETARQPNHASSKRFCIAPKEINKPTC